MFNFFKIIILLVAVLLSGCGAQNILINPETVQNKGLLIGHISSSPWFGGSGGGDTLIINGKTYKGAFTNAPVSGYFALPLPAGNYELESLYSRSGGSAGAVNIISSSTMPIKAKFAIKTGEITNLGEVFLLRQTQDSKRYNIIFLKNTSDMQAYMKRFHNDVYPKFKKKSFNLGNVKYVKKADVDHVRNFALKQSTKYNYYVSMGSLGAIGLTNRDSKGRVKSIKFLKTGTFIEPQRCVITKTKSACIIPGFVGNGKVFLSDKSRYHLSNKPPFNLGGQFVMLRDNSVLWMNSDFSFYKTRDLGKTWVANTDLKRNVHMSFWDEMSGSTKYPEVTQAKNGYYITNRAGDGSILYLTYKTDKVTKIKYPVKGQGLGEITETAKGLFARLDSAYYFSDTEIYFKANGASEWKKSIVPKSLCWHIKVKDYNAGIVTVSCRDKWVFQTKDLAASWKRIK